jgi:hypothetical protein
VPTCVSVALNKGFARSSIYYVVGLVLPRVLKHNESFCWGLFCMCLGFHYPICVSVRCDNGVTFRVVSYVLFLDFLSCATELVRVTSSIMLQRWKYGQSFVMFTFFANVAD